MYEIKEYRQQDGTDILSVSPYGVSDERACTLINAEKYDVLNKFGRDWRISLNSFNEYPISGNHMLHREVYGESLPSNIALDHQNHVKFDNVSSNLNPVTPLQNMQNKMYRRYINDPKRFIVRLPVDTGRIPEEMFRLGLIVKVDKNRGYIYSHEYNNEADACRVAGLMERVYKKYNPDYNAFDITKYMKDDVRTLLALRKGEIGQEEADFLHLSSYKNNAWYVLRYNLEDLFMSFNIPIPKYSLDENGYMIDPISNIRLCPSICNTREPKWNYSSYYKALNVGEVVTSEDIEEISSVLKLPERITVPHKKVEVVDENLLFTEMINVFTNYKQLGYSCRASLDFTKKDYSYSYSGDFLEKMMDKLHDSVKIVPEVTSEERKKEDRAVLRFFNSFCGVSLDTEQFLAEFHQVVIQKERFIYNRKAAVISSIDDYIHILGLNKVDLFIKYYRDKEDYEFNRDIYQNILNIEDLWSSLIITDLGNSECIISDSFIGLSKKVSFSDIPMYR